MRYKVCFITGTRAEFGLLLPLLNLLKSDPTIELQLLVTGAHLSPEFGATFQQIEKQGFYINEKVEMLLSSDTDTAVSKSVGLGIIGMTDALARLQPECIVLLGDRFEAFAAASVAYMLKIPIAHLHGGETTEGALDEGFRHSITKLSVLHFTSTEVYRKRVIQLGEKPTNVFNVGAIGLDNIKSLPLLGKNELSEAINFFLEPRFAVITFHPATLGTEKVEDQFQQLLLALDQIPDLQLIFTYPNADTNGRIIIQLLKDFVHKNQKRAKAFISLGQLKYLSALKHSVIAIGNSSSGIIEAPSFGIPTINIGDRQKGRISGSTVIDAAPIRSSIKTAIEKALSTDFQIKCKLAINPYGNGETAGKVIEILKARISHIPVQKKFYDLPLWN